MRLKPHAPYIFALALAGLSGGVLAAVAGDSTVLASNTSSPTPAAGTVEVQPASASGETSPASAAIAAYPSTRTSEPPATLPPAAALPPTTALPPPPQPAPYRWFPALLSPELAAGAATGPADIPDEAELERRAEQGVPGIPTLANSLILAFYGNPNSKRMGILGEYSKEDLAKLLRGYQKLYETAAGGTNVVAAYYLIYGTCWPGGEIGYLKDSVVKDYIDYAASQGMLVFIDQQIGKYPVADAVKRLLPFLKYPNVHLALDPEWRTVSPMKEVGAISADELNTAQAMIQDYLDCQRIPGVKMLVVHQFHMRMIEDRSKVHADFGRVVLIHTADGFGPPALKRSTYAYNALAENMPIKGFKLFFKTTVPGAGYDEPLLTPEQVLALNPEPRVVIYQ